MEPGVVRAFMYENVSVLAWHSAPTVTAIEDLFRLGAPPRRENPRGSSIATIMDGPARDAMVRVANELGETTAAVLAVDGAVHQKKSGVTRDPQRSLEVLQRAATSAPSRR